MANENSYSAYSRSSFDAIESTRRLSDDLVDRERKSHPKSFTNKCSDSDNDENANTRKTRTLSFHKKERSSMSNGAGLSSSSQSSMAKSSRSDLIEDGNDQEILIERNNGTIYDNEDDDKDEDKVDQRSESDSDLDSPDDFDENTYSNPNPSGRQNLHSNDIEPDRRHSEGHENNEGNLESEEQHLSDNTTPNQQTAEPNTSTSLSSSNAENNISESIINSNNANQNAVGLTKEPQGASLSGNDLDASRDSDGNHDPHVTETETIYNEDVVDQSEKLDEVKEIGVENLNKLQNLDKNDPSLRRLFMRPRVSPGEVQSVTVDPDIKSMVNEFLKTNVTENFIIARVLRENYATFYAWLASHMQTERNAWTARMGQALENAERERKGSLEYKNLVVEAATRLSTLAKTVGGSSRNESALHNYYKDEDKFVLRKGPSLRHGAVRNFQHTNHCAGSSSRFHDSDRNPLHQQNNLVEMVKNSNSGDNMSSTLRQSSFNIIEVSDPVSYESDPGTWRTANDDGWKKINRGNSHNITNFTKTGAFPKQSGEIMNDRRRLRNDRNLPSNTVDKRKKVNDISKESELYFGYTVNGVVVEYEDETDWKQVLTDSIEVLVEACDDFLTDKKACLQLLASKSPSQSQHERLVDVLSTYIQENQAKDYLKRKEIEKRLEILETENKSMQEEMAVLRKALLEKSEDERMLKKNLNRTDSIRKGNKADKCIGTDEVTFKKFLKSIGTKGVKGGKISKSKSPYMTVEGMGKDEGNKGKYDKHTFQNTVVSQKLSKSQYSSEESQGVNQLMVTSTAKNGYVSDASESYANDTTPRPRLGTDGRQASFIEISEEKLEKLKHRAKKLENSLHEAISSMDTLNKSAPWLERVRLRTTSEKPGLAIHIQKVKEAGNHHQTAKSIAYWKKPGLEANNNTGYNGARPIANVRNNNLSLDISRTPADLNLTPTLHSEPSSLLQGKSMMANNTGAELAVEDSIAGTGNINISGLKLVPDRSQGLTPRSVTSRGDGYHSDDEERRSNRCQRQDLSARSEISHKVRARRGQVKQLVSKCLRCQKLFSPTDNHKLACCYHTKRTDRVEHYDHLGMLVKVVHAWKCCNQPQEADGCCFGKHV